MPFYESTAFDTAGSPGAVNVDVVATTSKGREARFRPPRSKAGKAPHCGALWVGGGCLRPPPFILVLKSTARKLQSRGKSALEIGPKREPDSLEGRGYPLRSKPGIQCLTAAHTGATSDGYSWGAAGPCISDRQCARKSSRYNPVCAWQYASIFSRSTCRWAWVNG